MNLKRMILNVIFLNLIFFNILFISSCNSKEKEIIEDIDWNNSNSYETSNQDLLMSSFFSNSFENKDVSIFFLDIDNINNDNTSSRTYKSNSTINVGSCDSYIIKCGNTEILVDCGSQTINSDLYTKENEPYTFSYEYLKNNVKNNILRKITSICTDGVLDYLIVTHNDYDHLASLCVEGGVIDSFINEETITNLDNKKIKLCKISNVIDYNSGLIQLHSYSKIDKEKRLCKALYQTYITKINNLINKGTNYLPAAALFDSSINSNDNKSMNQNNKLLATPDKLQDYVTNKFASTILTEYQTNDAASKYVNEVNKNSSYINNVNNLGGSLKNEDERYYYSLELENGVELRVLYNWYYDFAYRQSFNGQSVNNPSVCIEVVKDDFKFLSFGDMGGNGESGIINYYKDTSVLKNITLFRASHHGSTTNDENSEALFKLITPKIIVVTGCAESLLEIKNKSAAFVKQTFFDNIYNALHFEGKLISNLEEEPYILCTNIDSYVLDESKNIGAHESSPFYGDICIGVSGNKTYLNYSYTGTIHAFLQTSHENDVIDFNTVKDNKIVKIQYCDWFNKVGLKYGG